MKIINNKICLDSTEKRKFVPNVTLKDSSIEDCIKFAKEMAFGNGYHKPNSFGNSHDYRKPDEVFKNTLQGKIAELAFYIFCFKNKIILDRTPDFGVWPKGIWEDIDFTYNNGKICISIKSTKEFGNFLLLEKSKYNSEGMYIETENLIPLMYDYFFLIRINGIDKTDPNKYTKPYDIVCEVAGFITFVQFKSIISNKQMLFAGQILGIPLKVDNYYANINELINVNEFSRLL